MDKGRDGWAGTSCIVTSLGRNLGAGGVGSTGGVAPTSPVIRTAVRKKNYGEDMRDSLRNRRGFWFSMRRIRCLSNSKELGSVSKDPLSSCCVSLLPGSIHGDEE